MGSVIDFSCWLSSVILTIPLAPVTFAAPTAVPFFFSVSLELPATVDGVASEAFDDLVASGDFFSLAFSAAAASLFFYLSTSGSSRKWKSL